MIWFSTTSAVWNRSSNKEEWILEANGTLGTPRLTTVRKLRASTVTEHVLWSLFYELHQNFIIRVFECKQCVNVKVTSHVSDFKVVHAHRQQVVRQTLARGSEQGFSTRTILRGMSTTKEPGSSVSIVSGYWLDDLAIEVRSPARQDDSSSNLCVQTGCGAHPASFQWIQGGPFPGAKARPGRDADHSPPSSAEVENK
jgi:hypothetical protein